MKIVRTLEKVERCPSLFPDLVSVSNLHFIMGLLMHTLVVFNCWLRNTGKPPFNYEEICTALTVAESFYNVT